MDLKKISLVGLSLFTTFSLMSCSSEIVNQTPAVNPNDLKPGVIDTATNTVYVGDAGNGKKGADLNFTITLPATSGFSTKADGITQGLASNINKVRVIVTPNSGASVSPETGTIFDSTIAISGHVSGTSKNYRISNLSTAGTYFIGIQFFNGSDNITKEVTYAYGSGTKLPLALSTSGFVVAVDNTGTNGLITVNPATVTVVADLRDGKGASVDAGVTAKDGATIPAMTVTNP